MKLRLAIVQLCQKDAPSPDCERVQRLLGKLYNHLQHLHTTRRLVELLSTPRTMLCRVKLEFTSALAVQYACKLDDYHTLNSALNDSFKAYCTDYCQTCDACTSAKAASAAAAASLHSYLLVHRKDCNIGVWPKVTHDRLLYHDHRRPKVDVPATAADSAYTNRRLRDARRAYDATEVAFIAGLNELVRRLSDTKAPVAHEKTLRIMRLAVVYLQAVAQHVACKDHETKVLIAHIEACITTLTQ